MGLLRRTDLDYTTYAVYIIYIGENMKKRQFFPKSEILIMTKIKNLEKIHKSNVGPL